MTDIFEKKLYVLTGICLFALFILSAVGLGSPAWRIGRYGSEQNVEAGLITRCYHDLVTSEHRCSPFMLGSQTAWFEVCRVFCSLSVALLLTLVVASAFLHFVDVKRQDFHYLVIGTILTGCTLLSLSFRLNANLTYCPVPYYVDLLLTVLGVTGAVIFAVRSGSMINTFSGQLAWGWAIFFTSLLFTVLMVMFFFYLIKSKRHRPRRRPVAPARDIIF